MKWGSWAALAAAAILGACGGDSADGGDGASVGVGSVQSELTKGTPGAKVGDTDYCGNSPTSKCALGEGDCDADQQCQAPLVCVPGNLDKRGPLSGDACAPAHCRDGIEDGNETSIDCGGSCGSDCFVTCDKPNGSPTKCSTDCPCSVGEGVCDSSIECETGLVCGSSNGQAFQLPAGTDVCWASTCQNGVKDGNETAIDCGGSCAPCTPPVAGTVAVASAGAALVPIVIAPSHATSAIHTEVLNIANELRTKLNKIVGGSGTPFAPVTTSPTPVGISVGIHGDFAGSGWPYEGHFRPTEFNAGGVIRPDRMAQREQYVLRTPAGSNRVIVAGATLDALKHAVWDLLGQAGYRHYFQTLTWEVVPSVPNLSFNLAFDKKPAFFARSFTFQRNMNPWDSASVAPHTAEQNEWRKHNRLRPTDELDPAHGYSTIMVWYGNQHGGAFPPALTTAPTGGSGSKQFCLTSTALVGGVEVTALDAVREWATNTQNGSTVVAVSPNVSATWVSAAPGGVLHCNDINDPTYSNIANRVAALANAAAEVQPTKIVTVRVPQEYGNPTIALRQNVFIVVDYNYNARPTFLLDSNLAGWSAAAKEVGVADRLGSVSEEVAGLIPVSTRDMVARPARYRALGAQQYTLDVNWGWGLPGPAPWALSQALWDADAPTKSARDYREDFLTHAFGSAKEAARKYYDVLEGPVDEVTEGGFERPFWSENMLGVMYRALDEGFDASPGAAVEARLTDLAIYTRYLELYRRFWNRCSTQESNGEMLELKQLMQWLYSTRHSKMLRSRDVAARNMADIPDCRAGTYCTIDGCKDSTTQVLTGTACAYPQWNVTCPSATPTTQCGSCTIATPGCNETKTADPPDAGDIEELITAGIANNNVFDVGLVRPFSRDLVPYNLEPNTLPQRLVNLYTYGPHYFYFQKPSSDPLTVHVKKFGPNQTLYGQLSLLNGGPIIERRTFGGTPDIETDWVFPTAGPGVHRMDLDDKSDRMYTTFPEGTRFALPIGRTDSPLALNYRWAAYFFVPAGTTHIAGWSQSDGNFFRYTKNAAGDWITPPSSGWLADFAVGAACTSTHDVGGSKIGGLFDHFVIPINPPPTTDEIWLFNDGNAGTVGERHLFSVPPYLYRALDEMLVPREVTPNNGNAPCTGPSDCAEGEYCAGGFCHSEGEVCTSSSQCAPGQTCQAGTCGGTGDIGDPCTDGSCVPGLECGIDNGRSFDQPPSGRYCWAIGCRPGAPQGWCGTLESPCGKCLSLGPTEPTCEPNCAGKVCGDNSDDGCGGTCVLCAEREGECHKDGECTPGLVCGEGAGPRFGLSGIQNACWQTICESLNPDEVPCGTIGSTCGLCPACQPDCQGKDYGPDGCGGSCGECASNEWPGPRFECFGSLGVKTTLPDGITPTDYVTQPAGTIAGAFEVTHQGEAQYTVPLVLPPGRAGMRPSLALTYNSAGGNGDLGQGWSLSGLQVITRCRETIAQDGVARGVKDNMWVDNDDYGVAYESSALCLDGSRLFLVPDASQLQYRTEIDTGVKVVAVDADNLDEGFLAYHPDGRIVTFGHPEVDADDDPRGFETIWVVTRVEDRAGNYMTVEHDARTTGSLRGSAILRPTGIWYAGHTDGTEPDTRVQFHYERRPDITSGFRNGVMFTNDDILKTVSISLGEMPMREYRLEHTVIRTGGASMLTRLDECVPAFEGGTELVCKPPTFFEYENDVPGLTSEIPIGFHPNNPESADFDVIPDMPLDMNGDGVDDLLMVVLDGAPSGSNFNGWDKHFEILMSGRDLINPGINADDFYIPADIRNAPELYNVLDYDLDGRDDLLMEDATLEGNYRVLTYKDSGFEVVELDIKSTTEGFNGNLWFPEHRSYILDADGDGVRDIVKCSSTSPHNGPWNWSLVHVPDMTERRIDFNGYCFSHYIAADLTGSGRQSLLMETWAYLDGATDLTKRESYLALSFEDAEYGKEGTVTATVSQTFVPVSAHIGLSGYALDANGDGFTDILNYFPSGTIETCLGSGRSTSLYFDCHPANNYFNGVEPGNAPARLLTESGHRYALGPIVDVNGDGRDDVMIAGNGESDWRVLESTVEGTWDAYYRTFSGWRVRDLPGAPPTTWSGSVLTGRGFAMDVNGDGVKDFVQKPTGGFGPANLAAYVRRAPLVSKLIGVLDGLGGRTEIEYGTTSTPVHPPDPGDPLGAHFAEGAYGGPGDASTCDYYAGLHCRTPRHAVVRKHRVFQGPTYLPNFVREFIHNYSNASIGLDGRGSLGFGFHAVTEQALGHSVVSWLDNVTRDPATGAFPFLGREYARMDISPFDNGVMVIRKDVQFDYRANSENERILTPFAHVTTEAKSETRDGVHSVLGTVQHTVQIDEYGNQTSVSSIWNGAYGRDEHEMVTTTFAYETRPEFVDDWLVTLPKTRFITSSGIFGESQTAGFFRTTSYTYDDIGLLERTTVEPSRAEFRISTLLGRDDYGNVETVESCPGVIDCAAADKRTVTTIYDARQVFPEHITDAEGYTKETEFHHGLGVLTRTIEHGKTGSTPLTGYAVYDGFGRIRVQQQPDGRVARTSYQSVASDGMHVIASVDGGPTVKRRYDELGRELSEGTTSLGGTEITTYTTYDVFGEVATRSRAQDSFNVDNRVEYDYDTQGRVTFVSEPGGAQSSNCYVGLIACAIDADNNARCVEKDHRGRILFASDPIELSEEACIEVAEAFASNPNERSGITYNYGPFSRVEQAVRMPENTVVAELRSDQLGRPESRTDIGSGTTTFTHTPFGELKSVTDSNAIVAFEYDKLGRRLSRTVDPVAAGEPNTTAEWSYRDDFQHRLDFNVVNGIETTVGYDDFGRVKDVTQNVDGEDFVASIDEYDEHGRPQFISYPGDAELRVENVYDAASGILKEVLAAPTDEQLPRPSYWKLDELDEFGQVTSETFGNGLVTTRTYHELTGLPDTIVTALPGGSPVQDVAHTFHDSRNLKTIEDADGVSQSYTYDAFGRIDEVREGGDVVADFGYTAFGSIEINGKGWSYGYDPASPHSVDTVEDDNGSASSFEYNDNGTLSHRSAGALPELNVEYTDFQKPRKVWETDEQTATTYDYNADQAKVAKRTPTGTTVYFGQLYYRETSTASGDVVHHYVIGNGQSVVAEVVRTVPSGGGLGDPHTLYLHTDHLGSVQVVTDEDATVVERRQFSIFGEDATASASSAATKLGYTGHWQEPEHGLIDMGGRFYDPQVGQFLSSDPLLGSPLRSESFNLKAYVNNNPLRFTDPSGFQPCDELSPCGMGGAPPETGGFEGMSNLHSAHGPYQPAFSENKYTPSTNRGPKATTGEKILYGGAGIGVSLGVTMGAAKLAVLCIGTGPACAAALGVLAVAGTGYAVYDLFWDGGAVEVAEAFTHLETKQDFFVATSTLTGIGAVVAKPITNVVTRRIAGGAVLTTYEEAAAARALYPRGQHGGYFTTSTNSAGGEVATSVGLIDERDFAQIVRDALARGDRVVLLTGAHGDDVTRIMTSHPQFFDDDLANWGTTAGVRVLNVMNLNPAQITGFLRGPGTTIGAFCHSGVCLAPFR
jgi:RHS repeat-associated protein